MSAMRFGTEVRIQSDEAPFYRKGGTSIEGSLVGLSRQGTVARVRLDNLNDTFVRTSDLEVVVVRRGPRGTAVWPPTT
jgi:hypothetical protein